MANQKQQQQKQMSKHTINSILNEEKKVESEREKMHLIQIEIYCWYGHSRLIANK